MVELGTAAAAVLLEAGRYLSAGQLHASDTAAPLLLDTDTELPALVMCQTQLLLPLQCPRRVAAASQPAAAFHPPPESLFPPATDHLPQLPGSYRRVGIQCC